IERQLDRREAQADQRMALAAPAQIQVHLRPWRDRSERRRQREQHDPRQSFPQPVHAGKKSRSRANPFPWGEPMNFTPAPTLARQWVVRFRTVAVREWLSWVTDPSLISASSSMTTTTS